MRLTEPEAREVRGRGRATRELPSRKRRRWLVVGEWRRLCGGLLGVVFLSTAVTKLYGVVVTPESVDTGLLASIPSYVSSSNSHMIVAGIAILEGALGTGLVLWHRAQALTTVSFWLGVVAVAYSTVRVFLLSEYGIGSSCGCLGALRVAPWQHFALASAILLLAVLAGSPKRRDPTEVVNGLVQSGNGSNW